MPGVNLTVALPMRQKTFLILAIFGLMVGLYLLGNQNLGKSQESAISLGGMQWITDYDQALRISEEGKPILIYFWRRGCPYCARMETEVFPTVEVSGVISKHFVPVALDIFRREHSRPVAKYGVYATPTFVIIDGGKKEIHIGYMDKGEFLEFLKPFIKNGNQFQSTT